MWVVIVFSFLGAGFLLDASSEHREQGKLLLCLGELVVAFAQMCIGVILSWNIMFPFQ